jgi:FtsX-like permease family protein
MVRHFFLMTIILPPLSIFAQDNSTINSTLRWDLATTIAYARQHNIQVNIQRLNQQLSEQHLALSRAARYLIEAIVISITGGIIGVALGMLASKLISIFLSWPTLVSESSIILSFMVCAFTGIFFGYYPAQKASRLDPIEALRYE